MLMNKRMKPLKGYWDVDTKKKMKSSNKGLRQRKKIFTWSQRLEARLENFRFSTILPSYLGTSTVFQKFFWLRLTKMTVSKFQNFRKTAKSTSTARAGFLQKPATPLSIGWVRWNFEAPYFIFIGTIVFPSSWKVINKSASQKTTEQLDM